MSLFWEGNTGAAVPVINLGDSPVSCTVRVLVSDESDTWDIRDAFTGRTIAEADVPTHESLSIPTELMAYGIALLTVRPRGKS